jgi:hypothetical protein
MTLQPGCVRAIDYEIVSLDEATSMGLVTPAAFQPIGNWAQLAVVRCVDDSGEKLTAIGVDGHFRDLLASGDASDPRGMVLSKRGFPVVLPGWQPALNDEHDESAVA